MKILYESVHSILEFEEVQLFQELGHTVFSLHGAYSHGQGDGKRPPLEMNFDKHLHDIAIQCSRENIHPELISWADVIVVMHQSKWVENNLEKLKGKKVVLRTIGQNHEPNEKDLKRIRKHIKIVRYSPMEKNIPSFAGEDALIRFYKDEDEFIGWTGSVPRVVNVSQAMFGNLGHGGEVRPRGDHMSIDFFKQVVKDFNWRIYGPDNDDAGDNNGGQLSYEDYKNMLRFNRVFFYTGTRPASYTLGLIEAMQTGIPVISVGEKLGNEIYNQKTFEIPSFIENGVNGFFSDNVDELRGDINKLMSDSELAKRIGNAGRATAVRLFGKSVIKQQWSDFFKTL